MFETTNQMFVSPNIFPVRQLGLLFPTELKVMTHLPNHQPVVT
jgi:hypothetical protein